MTIPCTLPQYAAALAALKDAKGVTVTPDPIEEKGSVTTPKVDFFYSFNGTQLMVSITAKHGMTKLVSDDVVYAHIQELLENA